MDTTLCLIRNDKIKSLVTEVMDTLKSKNFSKLIQIALSNFKEVKSIVLNCVNDDEPILKTSNYDWRDVIACRRACEGDVDCLRKCLEPLLKDTEEVKVQDRAVFIHKK